MESFKTIGTPGAWAINQFIHCVLSSCTRAASNKNDVQRIKPNEITKFCINASFGITIYWDTVSFHIKVLCENLW